MQVEANDQVYDRITIRLHWITALLVTTLWLIGRLNRFLPKGPLRLDIWTIHVLIGFLLLAVVLMRIGWRAAKGRHLPPADTGIRQVAAKLTHVLLYFLLGGVVFLGLWNALHGFVLFGVWKLPKLDDGVDRHAVDAWHNWFANVIMAVALFHALAAWFHKAVLKDHVLGRMWPAKR
jgi:cytochrome b561